MNTSNVSEMEVFGEDVFDSTVIKIIHGIGVVACVISGSIFYCGTIAYERFGGDPMKRSLRNKLIASIASAIMILHVWLFGFTWRVVFGPLNVQG